MNIALINPPPASEIEKHWSRFPLLGIAYVAASLIRAGHNVTLLDGKLDELDMDTIIDRASSDTFHLVGITCMTVEFPLAARIATAIKESSKVPICVGGAHVNAVGAQVLRECEAFDFACEGEGEYLFPELAAALTADQDLRAIDGLIFRNGPEVVINTHRPYPANYDDLPFPAWHLFQRTQHVPILTHRGCPFACTFCGHNSGFKPRYRSPANVLDEISEVIDRYRPEIIRFEDETFGLNMPRTKAILNGILERGFHRSVRFSAQTRVDRLDQEFVNLLRDSNFETLELGVESGNAEVLRRVKKGITLEQVTRAVALAKEAKLEVWCKFILGHPGETPATVMDTIRYIVALNPNRVSVSLMTPYPGTPIYDMAVRGEGGYRLLANDWKSFDKYSAGALELEGLSLGQLKRYQLLAYLMLYGLNWRADEFLGLIWNHRSMALSLVKSAIKRTFLELRGGKKPVPPPDSGLVQIR